MEDYQEQMHQESIHQDTRQQGAMYHNIMYQDSLQIEAEHMQNIFGGNDAYIKQIEKDLQVEIKDRNGEVDI